MTARKHAPAERLPLAPQPPAEAESMTERVSPAPFRWQFGLSALFGTMLLLCIPFAIWGAMLRADPEEQLVLTLLCIAAPLAVLVIAAAAFSIGRAIHKLRRGKRTDDSVSSLKRPAGTSQKSSQPGEFESGDMN